MTLISFIIPVFNVEKYLNNSVDSIINQNLFNYEILLIDDGSTDKSSAICDDYALDYSNIRVFHTENRGQSTARNTGIKNARGKYIMFLDSDDYYIDGALKIFESAIKEDSNIDLIIGKIKVFYEGTDVVHPKTSYGNIEAVNGFTGEEAFRYLIKTNQLLISPYSFLVKRKVLIENDILFDEELRCAEDLIFTPLVYFNSKNVRGFNLFFLMYRKNREGQITGNLDIEKEESVLKILNEQVTKVDAMPLNIQTKISYKIYLSSIYVSSLSKIRIYKGSEIKERVKVFKKYQRLINYSGGRRYFIPKIIFKFFGFKMYMETLFFMKLIFDKIKIFRNFKLVYHK